MPQDPQPLLAPCMPLNHADIARRLPHSGRMCLLESALAYDAMSITCIAGNHRDNHHPLRRDGRLPIAAGIEYAAQAMALHATLTQQATGNNRAMLVQLANVSWARDSIDECVAPLLIQVQQVNALSDAANYHFSLSSEGAQLIEGNILVRFETDTPTTKI